MSAEKMIAVHTTAIESWQTDEESTESWELISSGSSDFVKSQVIVPNRRKFDLYDT